VRSDMHKVVTERPRHGHGNPSRKWGARVSEDYEGAAFVSSARGRQYAAGPKEFSDFLAPLKRFLQAQVGRPWDKVYSEIRKGVPAGLHGSHLWSHIRRIVEIDCVERDGVIYPQPRFLEDGTSEVTRLYVHPRTGLLRNKPRRAKTERGKAVPIHWIKLGEAEEFRRINAIWYYRRFDYVNRGGQLIKALTYKKQLNRRELRELRAEYPGTESQS
jgi:hypothetical protein